MTGIYAQFQRRRQLRYFYAFVTFALIFLGGETWAKWWPYTEKLLVVIASQSWTHHSIFDSASRAGSNPSLSAGWQFLRAYFDALWMALVVGLSIAAGIQALLPRNWLTRILKRSSESRNSLVGGLLSIPCMMCTCCGAPITRSLVKEGVPDSSALAYWIGNPTLNPAVLAFLAFVGPWQWVLVRLVIGVILVFGITTLVAKFGSKDNGRSKKNLNKKQVLPTPKQQLPLESSPGIQALPVRYLKAWIHFAVTLLPEYLILVFLLGVFRGWLFPFGNNIAHWGFAVILLASLVGTLMVIPTAGEIPVLLSLANAGAAPGILGALLITLPAISLPSVAMLGNGFGWKMVSLMLGAVVFMGLVSAGLLSLIYSLHLP